MTDAPKHTRTDKTLRSITILKWVGVAVGVLSAAAVLISQRAYTSATDNARQVRELQAQAASGKNLAQQVTDACEGSDKDKLAPLGISCAAASQVAAQPAPSVSFIPVAGPSGPPGANGADGVDGAAGATGATGKTGPRGATGATGAQGPAGPSGAAGDVGPQGPAGPQGDTGPQGPAGPSGAAGPTCPTGTHLDTVRYAGGLTGQGCVDD